MICDYPNTDDGMYRVKRVIGLPGETIELKKASCMSTANLLSRTSR